MSAMGVGPGWRRRMSAIGWICRNSLAVAVGPRQPVSAGRRAPWAPGLFILGWACPGIAGCRRSLWAHRCGPRAPMLYLLDVPLELSSASPLGGAVSPALFILGLLGSGLLSGFDLL